MQHANMAARWAWRIGVSTLLIVISVVFTSASERGPRELRGKVAGVTGDRIHIELDQKDWLPRARGTKVSLGAEMAGMFVPLKGDFTIIQVNADSVVAMAVGGGEHGTLAAGMVVVIQTPYPHHPQRRADYIGEQSPDLLPMAQRGEPLALHLLISGCEQKGDHDNALHWWQQAARVDAPATMIAASARGIASILENRGDARAAVAALKDAVGRTKPRADEKTFDAYCATTSTVDAHISLLMQLGDIHRGGLNDPEESGRWYRAAADLMAALASAGAPPLDHPYHRKYLSLLRELSFLYTHGLSDPAAALSWLKAAARHGDADARKTLTEKGLDW